MGIGSPRRRPSTRRASGDRCRRCDDAPLYTARTPCERPTGRRSGEGWRSTQGNRCVGGVKGMRGGGGGALEEGHQDLVMTCSGRRVRFLTRRASLVASPPLARLSPFAPTRAGSAFFLREHASHDKRRHTPRISDLPHLYSTATLSNKRTERKVQPETPLTLSQTLMGGLPQQHKRARTTRQLLVKEGERRVCVLHNRRPNAKQLESLRAGRRGSSATRA